MLAIFSRAFSCPARGPQSDAESSGIARWEGETLANFSWAFPRSGRGLQDVPELFGERRSEGETIANDSRQFPVPGRPFQGAGEGGTFSDECVLGSRHHRDFSPFSAPGVAPAPAPEPPEPPGSPAAEAAQKRTGARALGTPSVPGGARRSPEVKMEEKAEKEEEEEEGRKTAAPGRLEAQEFADLAALGKQSRGCWPRASGGSGGGSTSRRRPEVEKKIVFGSRFRLGPGPGGEGGGGRRGRRPSRVF